MSNAIAQISRQCSRPVTSIGDVAIPLNICTVGVASNKLNLAGINLRWSHTWSDVAHVSSLTMPSTDVLQHAGNVVGMQCCLWISPRAVPGAR